MVARWLLRNSGWPFWVSLELVRATGRCDGRAGAVELSTRGRGDRKVGGRSRRSSDGGVAYFSRKTLGQSRAIVIF